MITTIVNTIKVSESRNGKILEKNETFLQGTTETVLAKPRLATILLEEGKDGVTELDMTSPNLG